MHQHQKIFLLIILFISTNNFAQLSFCSGSKGEPIFDENFGNDTSYGPALPAGTTNYSFISGSPNDGSYTLFYRTNLYSTWHYSLDHTPDATNGANGKSLIVNGNANTSGEFYKRIVTGLCINTTFEFSAWVMNVYNPLSGYCGINEKPINVQFEIWNDTETILLGSGNTGNIMGTSLPTWQQFGLVFTTNNETTVILKMKNNGVGGCGNDLAIDDVIFRSCGELTTITSSLNTGNSYSVCQNQSPISANFEASTTGTSNIFYQWKSSNDGTNWTDIVGATSSTYAATNISTLSLFRTKVAQDINNLSNTFCSTSSNVFTISFFPTPNNCISNGNYTICSNENIPSLIVTADTNSGVNWYDAPIGGNLLQSNSNTYIPSGSGTFYAEAFDFNTNCTCSNRTAVSLTIIPLPFANISGTTIICSGNSSVINISGTPNSEVLYTIDGGANQNITIGSNGTASIITPNLFTNSTYSLVSVSSLDLSSCNQTLSESAIITVTPAPFASFTADSQVCYGGASNLIFSGTPNAIVNYTINNGSNQFLTLNGSGEYTLTLFNITQNSNCTLVNVSTAITNGCTQNLTQSITTIVKPLPSANIFANPLTICSGQNSTLNFSGTPNTIITYSVNGGLPQTVTLNESGTASVFTANLTTNTNYQLISISYQDTLGCNQLLTDSVSIIVNQNPNITYTGGQEYCSNETTAISLFSDNPATTFNWTVVQDGVTGASSGMGNQINQTLTANIPNGVASYYVTPSYNGCIGNTIQIDVQVNPLPIPSITDGTICIENQNTNPQSQFYTLTTDLNSIDYNFSWYMDGILIPNANQNTYNANTIGVYSVLATNNSTGCISQPVSATVSMSEIGENLVIQQSEAFNDETRITITVVGGNGPFLYQLDDGLFQYSNVFTAVTSGTHIIKVTDENYCTDLTSTIYIVNFPKYFTPNNDGYNDTWNIKDLKSNETVLIYDRFGKLLKQITTNGEGWNGNLNQKQLPSDDYWFTVNYIENGIEKTFKSHFTLKR